jgi:hypothetical protein
MEAPQAVHGQGLAGTIAGGQVMNHVRGGNIATEKQKSREFAGGAHFAGDQS